MYLGGMLPAVPRVCFALALVSLSLVCPRPVAAQPGGAASAAALADELGRALLADDWYTAERLALTETALTEARSRFVAQYPSQQVVSERDLVSLYRQMAERARQSWQRVQQHWQRQRLPSYALQYTGHTLLSVATQFQVPGLQGGRLRLQLEAQDAAGSLHTYPVLVDVLRMDGPQGQLWYWAGTFQLE
jgi:hypothetical protein